MKPVRIGCSGWVYKDWRDTFYPEKLPQRLWLEHYSSVFDTVEINNTFYRLPSEAAVKGWASQTPADFAVTIKGSRYTTHIKRLLSFDKYSTQFFKALEPLRGGRQAHRHPLAAAAELPPGSRATRDSAERPRQPAGPPLLRVPARDVVREGHLRPAARARRRARHGRRSTLSVRHARGDRVLGVRALSSRRPRHPRRVLGGRARHVAPSHCGLATAD